MFRVHLYCFWGLIICVPIQLLGNAGGEETFSLQDVGVKPAVYSDTIRYPLLDSIRRHVTDTIPYGVGEKQRRLVSGLDSVRSLKLDSSVLPKTDVPTKLNGHLMTAQEAAKRPVDSLNAKILKAGENIKKADQVLEDRANDIQGKASERVQMVSGGTIDLPGDIPESHGLDISVPKDVTLPVDQSIPALEKSAPSLTTPAPGDKVDLNMDIPGSGKVTEAGTEIKALDSKLGAVDRYQADIQKIKEGDLKTVDALANEAEKHAANLGEVGELSQQTGKIAAKQGEYEAVIQRYRDKKLLQQELTRKGKNVVNEQINQFTPEVAKVQDQVAKTRKLNPAVQSFNKLTSKRYNEYKGRPLRERLVPGLTLQAYNKDVFTLDWGLQLGYHLSSKVTLGVGWVHRVGFSEDYELWVKSQGIYGYRLFGDYKLVKGLYVHGEFETLRVGDAVVPYANQEVAPHRAYNGYFGVGKGYAISKTVRGAAMVLYRAEFKGDVPTASKVNLRIVVEYGARRKR